MWGATEPGSGMNGGVYALAVDGSGSVYAGGDFTSAGTCDSAAGCIGIAKWDGSTWSALGSGMNGSVLRWRWMGAGACTRGAFHQRGHVRHAAGCNYVAKWDGSTWSALGSGMNNTVYALAVDGSGALYAGGYFTSAGTCDSAAGCNFVAKWDGSAWSALGSGMNSHVYALAVDGSGSVYAGGTFTSAGTCDSAAGCNYVAKWDGSTWSALGSGMNDGVYALAVDGSGSVYAGGYFTSAGTCDSAAGCNYVAKWDGSTWSALGSGMNSYVYALAVDGSGSVYAGGFFNSAGTCDSAAGCNYVAKWDGSTWSALGSGMNNACLCAGRGSLWVGGGFTQAGDKPSSYIAQWVAPTAVTLESLAATPVGSAIRVEWVTVSERDNLGFNLRRSTDAAQVGEPLNGELIPSQAPGSGQGASYEWLDATVEPDVTYYYWLESISLSGSSELHGPVSATVSLPTALTLAAASASAPAPSGMVLLGAGLALLGLLGWQRRR